MSTAELDLKPIKFTFTQTELGVWKTFDHADGTKFRQFTSHAQLMGRPLVCVAAGLDPETGKMVIADGWVAIGQRAQGVVAVGQFVNGGVAIGQFATGRIFALGQFVVAPFAIGQLSIGLAVIGQSGIAGTGIFQMGITVYGGMGQFVVDLSRWIPPIW